MMHCLNCGYLNRWNVEPVDHCDNCQEILIEVEKEGIKGQNDK